MNGLSIQIDLQQNLSWFFVFTRENAFFWVLLKDGTWNFQNSPQLERLACSYTKISGNFEYMKISGNFELF